ncbi:MAG: hypothetical protein HC769_22330 [Cyanobacteria bacterium CRU_2_1]|nr:hypothetical protein [Cyanobacteria bacterium CRU_2_1]
MGIQETDLNLLKGLTTVNNSPHIVDNLTLKNLSILWRHSWLSKLLKFKLKDWKTLLKILHQRTLDFTDSNAALNFLDNPNGIFSTPKSAFEFLEKVDHLKASSFTPDELNWLLAGDRSAKAATKETDAIRFFTALRQDLQRIKAEFAIALPTDQDGLITLLTSVLQKLNRSETEVEAFITIVRNGVIVSSTPAELIVKFYEPKFSVSLTTLPPTIDFETQLPQELLAKVVYTREERLLHFTGIMSSAEQSTLLALSNDAAYVTAINNLAAQPQSLIPPDERIWLTDTDLDATQSANDTYVKRLTHAITKALSYLSRTLTKNAIVQQSSAQLGLTEALTRHLLANYPILPNSLLQHLAENFALDVATLNGWYWANRVATLLKRWKITLAELEKIVALTSEAQLLDFMTLPLDGEAIASLNHFLKTSRLIRLRDSLPETEITLLEVLEKLNAGIYATAADFATDVERLNEDWTATHIEILIASLNLTYPTAYLLAETWERLRRAFYFLNSLNASANTVKAFAAAAMTLYQAKTLKELLRSEFGTETWLTLSTEIQDVLRERKRDALAAYLLTQPKPDDAPSGKWENTNDLYAYYLLDVEMSSCQLTSRLVQASGSVQLFVQRCFMGLEPNVVVKADGDDGDSAWRWWKWMRKYRVWEANRKVFLWPENWIEPELKKDRSSFFKDLENELLQNEINQDTVEKAFINYLEKLDGVAHLEIAGFYQEDDGDNTIIHVFGRTRGAEPHLYYYRRYDYRQWTPWEKVELDIQGDYLIPAVVNNRLFLFWPVFTEVPDEQGNSTVFTPNPINGATITPDDRGNSRITTPSPNQTVSVQRTWKKLRLQMAVSDYRQGKWTPKRISTDSSDESGIYEVEIVRKHYRFFTINLNEIDGRFVIQYSGHSLDSNDNETAYLSGAFEISGCKGVPARTTNACNFVHTIRPEQDSVGASTVYLKWEELEQLEYGFDGRFFQSYIPPFRLTNTNDFTLENVLLEPSNQSRFIPVLFHTPDIFKVTPPWHLSFFDELWLNGQLVPDPQFISNVQYSVPIGTWLPFFYSDNNHTFFVLPSFLYGVTKGEGNSRFYYPDIKRASKPVYDRLNQYLKNLLETKNFNLSTLTPGEQQILGCFIHLAFPQEPPPPYTDEQFKSLLDRFLQQAFPQEPPPPYDPDQARN